MPLSQQTKIQHLHWRAEFGISTLDTISYDSIPIKDIYATIEKNAKQQPVFFDVADNFLKEIVAMSPDIVMMGKDEKFIDKLSKEQKQQLRKQSREDLKTLNLKWLDEMVNTDAQLREKMSLFWHGHFACRDINIYYQQLLLQEIRTNALDNFGNMLKAVSKSASMLSFLNNDKNKKQHPNENFAREVMELFTMGRGNYTENDIKESARAFTGWSFNLKGEYVFRPNQHDNGSKTIFGKTGNFNGDDVLNMLLEQKQTARYITQKIYKYFVNDSIDKDKIEMLSARFYQSNYDIAGLMKDIFTSDWFYSEKNIGTKIKSPVELLIGMRRLLPMQIEKPEIQIVMQKALGQLLFYPPNVAGWAGGKTWIDSSTLMLRLQIPRLLKDNTEFSINTKTDDDQQMGMKEMYYKKLQKNDGNNRYRITATIDWKSFIAKFEKIPRELLVQVLQNTLLQTKANSLNNNLIETNVDNTSREAFIKTTAIALMSTPEYQLC